MARIVRGGISAGTLLLAVSATGMASASDYDSVESLWERYCKVVGMRDESEVLSCYEERLRSQLTGDKTSAGRARLTVHMSELFELLFKDYDYTVADEKSEGADKVTYTVRFKHRKKNSEHTSPVVFVSDGDRWYIAQCPEMPSFLKAGKGTVTMIAGVAVALVAIGFLVKKALG